MKKICVLILCASFLFVLSSEVRAADQMKLTITPPLIKNNMEKGQSWKSVIRVTNNTLEKLDVYAQVSDFKSREDGAGPEFIQKGEEGGVEKYFASSWIEIGKGPLTIAPQASLDVPFVINVPADASPGGHYAAIIIGNRPEGDIQGTAIKTSSQLASLILLSIKGEVVEKGEIREFSTDKNFYQDPKVNMVVRFSNQGNVHLQPKGEIKIFNLFNKEVGKFAINQPSSDYGNVLPESIRKWNFSWESSGLLASLNRYRADLILTFGNEGKETKNMSLFFWVINLKIVGIALGSILLIIVIIALSIKWYVRRTLASVTGLNQSVKNETEANNQPPTAIKKTVDLRGLNNQKKE